MIDPVTCLAISIFFEAATESVPGKWAVGQTIINRVMDKRWPNDICSVVKQKNQFTFYWDGKPEIVTKEDKKTKAWIDSKSVAQALVFRMHNPGGLYDFSGGANHYYNPNLATPKWRNKGELTVVIGNHIFRKL